MLNRWLAGKQAELRPERQKRPYLASECHDLNEADKWRQQILREIGKKVMEIQNAGLGDHRCGGLEGCCAAGACMQAAVVAVWPQPTASQGRVRAAGTNWALCNKIFCKMLPCCQQGAMVLRCCCCRSLPAH